MMQPHASRRVISDTFPTSAVHCCALWGEIATNAVFLSDVLTVSVGIRNTDESKTAQIITTPIVAGPCTDVVTFVCTFDNLKGNWDNITSKFGLQYSFADSAYVYFSWSKGFRFGGFNFRNARPEVIPPGPTKEEKNNTFELGLKSKFADGRARLNVAVFHNEIKDMQRELNIPDAIVIVLQATINAGDVTITGIEADFVWLPIDNLSLHASAGLQQGDYDRINPFVDLISEALGAPVLGPELPRRAENNYNVGFSWDISLGGAGLVNIAGNYSFREEHPYNDSNTEFFGDQKRSSASINWYSPNEAWQVSLYGKNLGDEANWGNLTSIAGLWTAGPMQKGRVIGAEIHYRIQ